MVDTTTARTKITFGCAREFKERLQALARRRGMAVGDVIIASLAEELKFAEFYNDDPLDPAQDDWQKLADEARARRGD